MAEELLIPKLAEAVEMEFGHILAVEANRKEQTMKCLEATDSNGTELYLFQLEDNSFISVPKEELEWKPLSPEELKEMKGADDESS